MKIFGGILLSLLLVGAAEAKTFYADASLAASCSGSTYSIASRNCTGKDGQGYKTLAEIFTNLVGGDHLYIRSGTYSRITANIYFGGALQIDVSGSAGTHTIVEAYPGDAQPVICTDPTKCQYNPTPGSTSTTSCIATPGTGGANCYYPNPAISVAGNYVDVIGLKTFGNLYIAGVHDVLIEGNDLGGGGPTENQGAVVMIQSTGQSYAITIRNNHIHHATWGESNENGSTLMGYNFTATIENNEFSDGWSNDVWFKDAGNQSGRNSIVRYNLFRRSTIQSSGGTGIQGNSQDGTMDHVYIYQNIFLNKDNGILWHSSAAISTEAYNNTFINCTRDIYDWAGNQDINTFNNLYYHSTGSQNYYDLQITNFGLYGSNYNNFYSTTTTGWRNLDNSRGTTLAAWRTYSGKDAASIAVDPLFINAAGTTPADFKRKSYAAEVTGSPYSTVTGAYILGSEIIGIGGSNPPPSDVTPPVVTITSPTSADTHLVGVPLVDLSGTASDAVGVTGVTFANSLGASGSCTGTTSWTCAAIVLTEGINIITVTASDAASNTGTDILTVTYVNAGNTGTTGTVSFTGKVSVQ